MPFAALRPLVLAVFAALAACGEPADAPEPAAPEAVAPGPRALVVHDGGPHVILRAGAEVELGHGDIEQLGDEFPVVVRRAAQREGVTPDEARWEGRKVQLIGARGVACEGIVSDIQVLGRFNMGDGLRYDLFDDDGNPKVTPAEFARESYEYSPSLGSLDLVGRVDVLSGDCSGAVWAQLSGDAAPPSAEAEPAPPELRRMALEAARATEAYQHEQAAFDDFKRDAPADMNAEGYPERWEDYNSNIDVAVMAHPGGETLLSTTIQAGEGCGDFSGSVVFLWRLRGDSLEPIPASSLSASTLLLGAADIDSDGRLDLITPTGYLRQTDGGFDDEQTTAIPDNIGCGC